MPPVPCVHLNVHVDNVKKVLCGSGVGVEVSGTNVKITRKWGHCDDIMVFTKGKVVCKSTIDESLHQIKASNMGTMYGIIINMLQVATHSHPTCYDALLNNS